ncbi:methionyl-tRNA formyltransferase [Eisenbergiella sp.]
MKVVFMGTPDFAVGALEAIWKAGHEITAVVTQPDKPKGRGGKLQMSPIKEFAVSKGLPVFQPVRIKRPEAVEQLKTYEADIFVVAAFGQILSQEILDMPRFGCVNIHASLLPKYRGSAPIQWAIINGDKKTGVTIMQMDAGVDTGDMLMKSEVEITPSDTYASLGDKLAQAGAQLIIPALAAIEKGEVTPVPQDDALSCHVGMIDKTMGKIDFSRPAEEIDRLIRGLNPWPSAYTSYKGKTLKIWEASPLPESADGEPGSIQRTEKDAVYINTGNGVLKVTQLQLEGKKRMQVKDFLLGCRIEKGEMLGC